MSKSRHSWIRLFRHNTYPSGLPAARNNSSQLSQSSDDLFETSKLLTRSNKPQHYDFRGSASACFSTSQEMSRVLEGGQWIMTMKFENGIYVMYGETNCTGTWISHPVTRTIHSAIFEQFSSFDLHDDASQNCIQRNQDVATWSVASVVGSVSMERNS